MAGATGPEAESRDEVGSRLGGVFVEPWQAEWRVLRTEAGWKLLEEVGRVARPGPAEVDRWRKRAEAEEVAAAMRLIDARRKGACKFSRASRMWLEAEGIEQATGEEVAGHKARRFEGMERVVDLCSGVGGDAIGLARAGLFVMGVDADPAMPRRLRWNAEVYGLGDQIVGVIGRAERGFVKRGVAVHVDPDRRGGHRSGRAKALEDYRPGRGWLRELVRNREVPGGAIKLGPASDFLEVFGEEQVEIEVISLGRECKEATVWFGALARGRRRATCLPLGVSWTERDGPMEGRAGVSGVDAFVFDPDPALVRAKLVDSFAVAHGLSRMSAGVDYLTGPTRLETPFLDAFEVLETSALDLKRLKRSVGRRGLGPLEVKVRGLDVRPEEIRGKLDPPGPLPGVLILAGGKGKSVAVLARRVG